MQLCFWILEIRPWLKCVGTSKHKRVEDMELFIVLSSIMLVVMVHHGFFLHKFFKQQLRVSQVAVPLVYAESYFCKNPFELLVLRPWMQTPGSPVASGSSGGRKTSKRIILVCHGVTQNNSEVWNWSQMKYWLADNTMVSSICLLSRCSCTIWIGLIIVYIIFIIDCVPIFLLLERQKGKMLWC